jgi:hypothetical protein
VGAGADTWRLRVLHVNDHLAGRRLIGQRAPRPELQHVAPQAHLALQLFGPLRAGLYVPGQKFDVLLSSFLDCKNNGRGKDRWSRSTQIEPETQRAKCQIAMFLHVFPQLSFAFRSGVGQKNETVYLTQKSCYRRRGIPLFLCKIRNYKKTSTVTVQLQSK